MEDLSKFLPLYLGQYAMHGKQRIYISGFNQETGMISNINGEETIKGNDVKLILRNLSSMTEEEGKALGLGWETRWDKNGVPHTLFQPEAFIRLIEWGFDIFRLKEKGLALYEDDLK